MAGKQWSTGSARTTPDRCSARSTTVVSCVSKFVVSTHGSVTRFIGRRNRNTRTGERLLSSARLNQPLRQTNYSLLLSVIRLFGECLAQEARKPACKSERRYGRTKDERRTDSGSHPHGLVAGFNLVTQQNMEPWMTFYLVQGRFQGVVSQIRTFVTGTGR